MKRPSQKGYSIAIIISPGKLRDYTVWYKYWFLVYFRMFENMGELGKFLNGVRNGSSGWLDWKNGRVGKLAGPDIISQDSGTKTEILRTRTCLHKERMEGGEARCHHHPCPWLSMRGKHEGGNEMEWSNNEIPEIIPQGVIKLKNKSRWKQSGYKRTQKRESTQK